MFKDWGACVKDGAATLGCIQTVFLNAVSALLMFAGTFAFVLLIFSIYKYINSGGDPKKLEGARNTLIYGILGLIIVLFAFLIRSIIVNVTGVECIKTFGFGC